MAPCGVFGDVQKRPAMRLNDRSADGKPHTHAVWFRREQGLEDAIGYRRIYACAHLLGVVLGIGVLARTGAKRRNG
jgi:hypothetical protein